MGGKTLIDQVRTDSRFRVIFDNGTESNMLMRSLERALNKDEVGRRIAGAGLQTTFLMAHVKVVAT